MPFNKYAEYYNLLYRDKDYITEAEYVRSLLAGQDVPNGDILELGCGTGRHAELLAESGYNIHGIDLSEGMLTLAQKKSQTNDALLFEQADIRSFRCEKTFDAVISLFHVMSYQTRDEDFLSAVETAALHLKAGGVFIFDYWYGPAVMSQRPENRRLELNNQNISLIREAVPTHFEDRKIVDINYRILVKDKLSGKREECHELHSMRYFYCREIEHFLNESGFQIQKNYAWLKDKPPDPNSWSACTVCIKGK